MKVTQRRYKILVDFERVHTFLTDTYDKDTLNSYLLPQYFEYAHHHSYFKFGSAHRNGIWEENGEIVGVAVFEMELGDCHLHVKVGYESLLPEMLTWAENELSAIKDGKRVLNVWITSNEPNKREMLKANGYSLSFTDPVKLFNYNKPFVERTMPENFTLINGTNVDHRKLHACFWRGFDHGDIPDYDIEGNIAACNAPRSDMSLMTIAVAPDGEYACALGMWFDDQNRYAYLEPLATVPAYRRMGLATICLMEAMKKTKALGAQYCFGGAREFYTDIGFDHVCDRELWHKEWSL